MEAVYDGTTVVWCAVGFRNGGGNDEAARKAGDEKFREDLARMRKEDPSLKGFVFFTNIDLTPAQVSDLRTHAISFGVSHVAVFDFEKLRHVLDTAEGMIARLQYLHIAMSETEQLALVSKFGRELQRAVTTRLDRVDRTLGEMERFMAFQKPIFRLEAHIEFVEPVTSNTLGDGALLLLIHGLRSPADGVCLFCRVIRGHARSTSSTVLELTSWIEDATLNSSHSVITHPVAVSHDPASGLAPGFFSLIKTGNQIVRLNDVSFPRMEVVGTANFCAKVKRVLVDVNGYELFAAEADATDPIEVPTLPRAVPFEASEHSWVHLVRMAWRDFLNDPPRLSGRLLPLKLTITKTTSGSAPDQAV